MRKHTARSRPSTASASTSAPARSSASSGPTARARRRSSTASSGQIKPTAGHVAFCGEDITGMSPLELSRRGVGRTFQTLQVFGKLSVRDNLIAAAQEFKGTLASRLFAAPDAGLGEHADRMIEMFRLKHVAHLRRGHAVLRPAEAHRHRDGLHAGAAPRAARRAVRGRQPEPRRPAARAPGRAQQGRRAAASS